MIIHMVMINKIKTMDTSEANSKLLTGLYAIGIIHLSLLNSFVNTLPDNLTHAAEIISFIGMLFIAINGWTWLYMQDKYKVKVDFDERDNIIPKTLILPSTIIFIAWTFAFFNLDYLML